MNSRSHFSFHPQGLVALFRIIKIEIAISAVMICAMGILAMMALAKFNSTLAEVTDSRISVIAYDMRDNIEQGLALGINLQALENVEDTIERAAKRDPKISAIYVIGRQGNVLYRSPSKAPDLSEATVAGFEKAVLKKPFVSSRQGGMINTVTILQNTFAQTVGLLVVKYDATALQQRFDSFQSSFLREALLFLLGGVVLTAFTTWLVLKRFEKTDERLAQTLDTGSVPSPNFTVACPEFSLFREKEQEVLTALTEAEQALEVQ